MRLDRCPLCTDSDQMSPRSEMTRCARRRHIQCSKLRLFDYLVGEREQRSRNVEPKCLRGLEVDHQIEFGWLLNRKIAGLFALQDAIDVTGRLPGLVGGVAAIGHQATAGGVEPKCVGSRQAIPYR